MKVSWQPTEVSGIGTLERLQPSFCGIYIAFLDHNPVRVLHSVAPDDVAAVPRTHKTLSPNEVERAEAAILVNGERPVRPDELRRFRLLVWMELEGRLLRNRPTHVRAS